MKGLELKILTGLNQLITSECRNPVVKKNLKILNTWRLSSTAFIENLYNEYYKGRTVGEKHRLVFSNKFKYLFNKSGEYFLATYSFLSLFSRKIIPVFLHSLPIFSIVKSFPMWWLNTGIITSWNFYFKEEKLQGKLKEMDIYSINKLFIFPKVEYTFLNFIETYESKPTTIPLIEKSEMSKIIELYLRKNFTLIPYNDVKSISASSFLIYHQGRVIPCSPHRVIIKPYKIEGIKKVSFLKSKNPTCLKIRVKYFTSAGDVKDGVVYYPLFLDKVLKVELNKIYNALIFSFTDIHTEWVYPIIFSFYEEDISSYEIFQEILLSIFRERWKNSSTVFYINISKKEIINEILNFARKLYRREIIDEMWNTALFRLGKESLYEILTRSLFPMIFKEEKRIWFLPFPIGVFFYMKKLKDARTILDVLENDEELTSERIIKLLEKIESQTSLRELLSFLRSSKNLIPFFKYLKPLINNVEKTGV